MLCELIGVRWELDSKTVGFFSVRREKKKNRTFSVSPQSHSPFSASFQTFCLTARAYLNTQKYGLFCSLDSNWKYCDDVIAITEPNTQFLRNCRIRIIARSIIAAFPKSHICMLAYTTIIIFPICNNAWPVCPVYSLY